MDKTGADFIYSVKSIGDRLGAKASPIQLPIGAEENFTGIIDLVEMKAYHFDGKAEEIATEIEIPAELKAQAEELRAQLVEAVVEYDEELMIKFLDGEELTIPEIKSAIRKGVIGAEFFPVLAGSAFKNKGVKLLLDAVIDYLPSPLDVPSIKGILEDGTESERHPSDTEPFSALAFKVMTDPFVGSYVTNTTKDKKERIGRILQMHANNRSEIEIVYAGDIAAAVGLKDTTTGDTLSDDKHPIILERMVFPEPVIQLL
ncbi:hypothetical protein FQA39_LY13043 [Lamprigera yunnana]|nr:hypothetical protein FQA39_LY13043 [Lamprigera yunnana]